MEIRHYSNHPLLESCLQSLIPYFDIETLPENIAHLKITEAVSILLRHYTAEMVDAKAAGAGALPVCGEKEKTR